MKLEYVLSVVLTVVGSVGLFLINQLVLSLRRMAESVESLNVKIAVVCERVETHEKRFDEQGKDITWLKEQVLFNK